MFRWSRGPGSLWPSRTCTITSGTMCDAGMCTGSHWDLDFLPGVFSTRTARADGLSVPVGHAVPGGAVRSALAPADPRRCV